MSKFAKRRNPDGTMDSICLNCFRTVATCTDQLELIEFEKDHRCMPDEEAASKQAGEIVAFPPERMVESHRRQQRNSVPPEKIEKAQKRIEFRK